MRASPFHLQNCYTSTYIVSKQERNVMGVVNHALCVIASQAKLKTHCTYLYFVQDLLSNSSNGRLLDTKSNIVRTMLYYQKSRITCELTQYI